MTTISQHHQASNSSNSAIKRHLKTIKDAKIAQDMARKLKLKAKAASKAIRKIQHTRKKTSRKSHSRRTVHCVSRGQKSKSKKPYVAQYKAIKGYKDGYEAARAHKSKFANNFLKYSLDYHGKRNRGWNHQKKNYSFGGTSQILVRVKNTSPIPIDDSALLANKYKHVPIVELHDKEYIFYEFYTKTVLRKLGVMTYDEAKEAYAKEHSDELQILSQIIGQFDTDNNVNSEVERRKWFKLIVR